MRIATYLASPDEQAALQALIDAYEVEHPDVLIEIKPLFLSPPETIAQLTGATPIEGGWDLAIHTVTSLAPTIDVAMDLNDLPELVARRSEFHPAVAASVQVDGKWGGLPLEVAGFNIAIDNLAALDELGISGPPQSLDELVAVCDAYVAMGKGPELPVPLGEASDALGPLVAMTAFLPAAATFGTPPSPDTLVQSWRRSIGALEHFTMNDCILLVDDLNGNGSHHDENFDRTINGRNALGVGPVWGLSYFIAQGTIQEGNFDFGPLIGDEAGFIYTVEFLMANAETPHREEVADFLEIASRTDVQLDYLRARGGTPALVFDDPSQIDDSTLRQAYTDFQEADADGRAGLFPDWLIASSKFGIAVAGPLRELFAKTATADEVIEAYLCEEPRHPTFASYESTEACLAAVRAVPTP